MKTEEFKAWFEGFTESMDSTPNEKQWKRIKAKVAEIDGTSVVYTDRYHSYFPYAAASVYPFTINNTAGHSAVSCGNVVTMNAVSHSIGSADVYESLRAIGRSDAGH